MPCEAQNSYALWIVVNSFRIWYDIIKPIHRYRLGRIDTAHFKRKFKLCDLQLCPELMEAHSGFKQFDFSAFDCSGIFRFQTLSSSGADFLQTANAIEIRNQFVKTDRQVLRLGGLLIYFLSMSVTQPWVSSIPPHWSPARRRSHRL